MYSERLLDHFQNPRNVGELPPPAVTVEVSNPACGDILRLSVRFEKDRASGVPVQDTGMHCVHRSRLGADGVDDG